MASVYLKKDSACWYAKWRIYDPASGKWRAKCRSTRKRDRAAAENTAAEWQRNADLAAASAGAVRKSGPAPDGKPKLSPREAEILAAAMARDPSRDPRRKAGLWAPFAAQTLAGQEDPRTRAGYELCVRRWEEFCAGEGRPMEFVEDADAGMAERWRESLRAEGLGARRVNFHLMAVGQIYRRAARMGLVSMDPFAAVAKARLSPTRDNLSARPFSDEEVERLALAPYKVAASLGPRARWAPGMAEEWEVMIRLGAVTGQRLSDAIALEWDSVDLEAGVIDYLPRKTRRTSRRIAFPLRYWPEEMARLRRWRTQSAAPQVFPNLFATSQTPGTAAPTAWASAAFARIIAAAGIDRAPARLAPEDGKGRARLEVGFHSLRHTANTRCAAAGVPAEIRKELFGHSTVEMNRVYTHWDESVLAGILDRAREE